MAVDPALYPAIEGSTDSEVMFYLALTFGLEDDPPQAVARDGRPRRGGRPRARRRAPDPDDGRDHRRRAHLGVPLLQRGQVALAVLQHRRRRRCARSTRRTSCCRDLGDETRLVVSEPLGDLPGAWNEVPESQYGVIQPGQDEMHPFAPTTEAVGAGRAN